MPKMPQIVAYHPTVEVVADKKKYQIECKVDDWCPDGEVVGMLHAAYRTDNPEDLVAAIRSRDLPDLAGIQDVRLKNA